MNNIYVEIQEKCCSQCDAECDGCWLEELISDRLAEERKKVVQEIRKQILKHFKVKSEKEYEENLSLLDALFTADVVFEILDQIERGE